VAQLRFPSTRRTSYKTAICTLSMIFSSNGNKQTFDRMGGQVSLWFRTDWILGSLTPLYRSRITLPNPSKNHTLTLPRLTRLRSKRLMVRGSAAALAFACGTHLAVSQRHRSSPTKSPGPEDPPSRSRTRLPIPPVPDPQCQHCSGTERPNAWYPGYAADQGVPLCQSVQRKPYHFALTA